MRPFRDVSIKRKLIGITMVTSSIALILACGTFLAYELVTYRKTATQQLTTLARIVADSSTAALTFGDRRSAGEALAALREEPNLTAACLYTKDGRPLATFLRGESRRDLPRRPGSEGAVFRDRHLVLFLPVFVDGEAIGTVYLKRDLLDMYLRLERYAGIVCSVLLASSLVALLVSSRLQRVISEPTLRLAELAGRVSAERDYTLRAAKRGNDEIGALVDRFNEMMGQIQARTRDRDEAQRALERHVIDLCDEIERRRRVQEELLAAKHTAEESSRAKSAFLANMSHELRTPLNAILGYSEMLHEDAEAAGDPQGKRAASDLARITSAGRHLLTLINEVLDLSKAEAGKTELTWDEASTAEILEDAAGAMAPLARKNGNRIVTHYAAGLPMMQVDVVKFRQSLYNLMSNACKFTQNGTVEVDVEAVTVDGAEAIEWRVSDTGIGIAADQMHKLFQPFSQVDASTTRKYGGTGLGLAISQRFCQLMGGKIMVASEVGRGSTFTIRLPLRNDRVLTGQPPPAAAASAAVPGKESVGAVLVIDDDPTVHDLMTRCLVREGFEVATASSGPEGLRKARETRPAAITLDVFMPGMDGWAVLNALKSDPELAEIPVILLTISDDRRRACLLGADDFLQKPVETERLAAALQRRPKEVYAGPVLVVDDDAASRDLEARALRKQFDEVIEAEDGRSALERMARQRPALIVLDLSMPGMDGFDFIRAVRQVEDWRSIPVVVLSAREVNAGERRELSTGVRRILRKGDFPAMGLACEVADLLRDGLPAGPTV